MTSCHHNDIKFLFFLSRKGGAGKTTLAVHSAVAAIDRGETVVVVDTDPQRSATMWAGAREAATPIVATAATADVPRVLRAAENDGLTLAILDTAPHAAPEANRIATI